MKRKNKLPKLAPPVAPSAPEMEDSPVPEKIAIKCPMCQTHWANASIRFGEPVSRKQFAPREDLSAKIRFQKNELPFCPVCNFKYDERAMMALMIAAANECAMERKLWGREDVK